MAQGSIYERFFKTGACLHAGGAVIAVVIVLGLVQVDAYLSRNAAALEQRYGEALEFASRPEVVRKRHAAIVEQLQSAERVHNNLRARVAGPSRESLFLTQVSELASRAEIELRDFRPGQVGEIVSYQILDVQVRAQGSYAGCCRFVAGLNELPRVCRISQANLSSSTTPGGACSMELQMQLVFDATSPRSTKMPDTHDQNR